MLPKYIEHKIDQLYELLNKADTIRNEIEEWAKKKNIDTSSNDWYETVVDDCFSVSGIYKDGIEKLLAENR